MKMENVDSPALYQAADLGIGGSNLARQLSGTSKAYQSGRDSWEGPPAHRGREHTV